MNPMQASGSGAATATAVRLPEGLNGNVAPVRFSTNDLPERDRLAVWREVIGRQVVRLDIEPISDRPLDSEVYLRVLPGLSLMSGTISDHRVARTRELITDANDDLRLEVRCTGGESIVQGGREVVLGRGDATLVSCAELMTAVQSRGRFLGLHLPRAALAALVPNVEDAAISRIPRDTQALRLLVSYVGVLQDEDALATPELRRSVVAHIHDLAALAIGATRDGAAIAEGRGGRAARLRAIKLDIIDNLGRSDLTINALARRHRLQPRYIQRLFEFEGTTFSEFTMRQRLSRSYRMLADPRHFGWTIGAIAFACGFGDQSHFNRHFRQVYGMSPSDVRAMARRQA
jgi:AraC-like DNA-binding protein